MRNILNEALADGA